MKDKKRKYAILRSIKTLKAMKMNMQCKLELISVRDECL